MTYDQIKKINDKALAIPNKIYTALDATGVLRRWRGTSTKRLVLIPNSTSVQSTTPISIQSDGVQSVTASTTQVTVDNTDPLNPIVDFNGVEVDGVTITGSGQTGDPLIATATGTVTSVLGTANRITSSGGANPIINISASYDALWQPIDADLTAIAALGFTSTSFLKKTAANTWALDTNTYITTGSAVTSVSGTAPVVSSGGTTPAISIPVATSIANGYLSSIDWSTFNSKQTTISVTTPITLTGASVGIVNQGTTTTVLHGNAAGNASFGTIVAADITNGTITGTQIASSIALAGSPTTTTQTAGDNSTKIATTAYVDAGISKYIYLTADKAVTGATPTEITDGTTAWNFSIGTADTYIFDLYVPITTSGTSGAFFNITFPAGGVCNYTMIGNNTTATAVVSSTGTASNTNTGSFVIYTAAAPGFATLRGSIITTGTSGTVSFRIGDNNAGQTVTAKKGAFMTYKKLN